MTCTTQIKGYCDDDISSVCTLHRGLPRGEISAGCLIAGCDVDMTPVVKPSTWSQRDDTNFSTLARLLTFSGFLLVVWFLYSFKLF